MKVLIYIVTLFITILGNEMAQNRCRYRDGIFRSEEDFGPFVCYECFRYASENDFSGDIKPNLTGLSEFSLTFGSNYSAWEENDTLVEMFRDHDALRKLKKCCENGFQCCQTMLNMKNKTEEGWCPRTWDGWMCWNDTPPGHVPEQSCPIFALTSAVPCTDAPARKECLANGSWFRKESHEWTNYTECSVQHIVTRRIYILIGAYATSIVSLIPALAIFQKYRALKCHKTVLHKNLFISLLCHCICDLIFNSIYIYNPLDESSMLTKNSVWCKILTVLTRYFRLTNYMWMMCEGFHLYRQIAHVFAEEASLKIFYSIGWGFPILPIIGYIVLRAKLSDDACWAYPNGYIDLTLHLPCFLTLLLNTIFIFYIVKGLVSTLSSLDAEERGQFRKARKTARAIVNLFPLFGLHFLLIIYRPKSVCSAIVEYYILFCHLVDGLQGLVVAIIFCYMNSEVTSLLKRSWRNVCDSHNLSQYHFTYNRTTTSVINSQSAL